MSAQKSGGPLARGAAATTKTRNHHEAGPRLKFTAPGRRAERIAAGHRQYQIDYDTPQSASDRFDQFHAKNPHVYPLLTGLAREWKDATQGKKLGIRCLYERLRWEIAVTTDSDDFKLNDHYQEPDLRGLFELRRSPEADAWIALHKHGVTA
jgi:hypothetical protein